MTVPPAEILQRLRYVVPQLNDLAMLFGADFINHVQSMDNLPAQISAGVTGVTEMIDRLPAIAAGAFSNSIDPRTKRFTLRYSARTAALPTLIEEVVYRAGPQGFRMHRWGPLAGLLPDCSPEEPDENIDHLVQQQFRHAVR